MAVTHTMVSVIDDGADDSLVQPSDWNANHSIETVLPDADSTHDLGSGSYRWQHAYVEGVAFPATQVASADVNILDDYQEGDWTPTGYIITFASASGTYTKIGRLVVATFAVHWPVTGDSNGANIMNLPFTIGATTAPTLNVSIALDNLTGLAQAGNAHFDLRVNGVVIANSALSDDWVYGSIVYPV